MGMHKALLLRHLFWDGLDQRDLDSPQATHKQAPERHNKMTETQL